jgi:hypothetical protein
MAKCKDDLADELGLPAGLALDPAWLMGLIDDEGAAPLCGLLPQSLRKRRMQGEGPAYVRLDNHPRGRVRYRRIDCLRWAAERRHENTSAETWEGAAVGAAQ